MNSKLAGLSLGALTLLSSCLFLEESIQQTSPDQGVATDMMGAPEHGHYDMALGPDQRPAITDMSQGCEQATCEPSQRRCADAVTLERCELINGCLTRTTTACEAGQRCVAEGDQPARCVSNPCTSDEQTLCSPDQRVAITCVASALEGVFLPQAILCLPEEACDVTLGQCVPHECTEEERRAPYLCKTSRAYTQCQQVEGLRILSEPVSCAPQQRCVPGEGDPTKACECEHQCQLDEAACDTADPSRYKVCVEDPSTGCRAWQLQSCPAPSANAADAWLNLGCFKGDQGPARLKCWRDDGRCALDKEPGCRD